MGEGDPQLGQKLLITFLKKLAESDTKIDIVGCVNSGVYLTTKGSKVIDSLQKLEINGAKIATCGTCLEHFRLKDKLLIGGIGTMDGTVEIMSTADRIIRPNWNIKNASFKRGIFYNKL